MKNCCSETPHRRLLFTIFTTFTRAAWEAQIDLEEFTERDVEQEAQILIEKNQNMDPDTAEKEK